MKLEALAALFSLLAAANAHEGVFGRHAAIAQKRQDTTSSVSSASSSVSSSLASSQTSQASTTSSQGATSAVSSASATSAPVAPSAPAGPPATGANGVPPLSQITSGMPAGTTYAASETFPAGSTPSFSGAPPLPTPFVFSPGNWPAQDKIPPTDSPEVQEWIKELDGVNIPDFAPTVDGSCGGDPAAAAQAEQRGWWTCGGWTGPEDITMCPEKLTWGISFDDGPGPYTQKLLDYLDTKNQQATFFVVGSRCIERPQLLIEEHMAGHEISVHTWSHHALTTMTNEEIVAELGWTRKIIKEVLGVTPTTMRAPFGDIDNRVRAISLAMGLRPIQWTRFNGFAYDTNDWKVAAGTVSPTDQMATFNSILGNATLMDNGFIVLEHDLYEQTVDLAVGYTLDAARTHNPPFKLQRIGECMNIPLTDMYLETTTNTTFPAHRDTNTSGDPNGAANQSSGARSLTSPAVSVIIAAGMAVVGGSLLL